jgi:hypothetical protein
LGLRRPTPSTLFARVYLRRTTASTTASFDEVNLSTDVDLRRAQPSTTIAFDEQNLRRKSNFDGDEHTSTPTPSTDKSFDGSKPSTDKFFDGYNSFDE